MLLWINGPFGGGKTQTAHELHRRLPGSVLCDPEEVGFGLHRMLPGALREDFQTYSSWRGGVFEMLDLLLGRQEGTVIAPMTLVEPLYFAEIVGRLREKGHEVRHFALLAARETVLHRLTDRGLGFGGLFRAVGREDILLRNEQFAVGKLDRCLEQLSKPEFGEHIWTDTESVAAVADRIAATSGLTLTPNTDNPLRGKLRRVGVTLRHTYLQR